MQTSSRHHAITAVGVLALLAACSDDNSTPVPDHGIQGDSVSLTDGPSGDSIATDGPSLVDQNTSNAALQSIVDKMVLPTSESDFARDLDGDGKKENKLGGLLAIFTGLASMDLQGDMDSRIQDGTLLLLAQLFAQNLQNDGNSSLQMNRGLDSDQNPADNFSGSEPFTVVPGPAVAQINGSITSGAFEAGPGTFQISFPLGANMLNVALKKAYVSATISGGGLTNGQISGAIPQTEVASKILPEVALSLNMSNSVLVKSLFDTDKDGTVTVSELQSNGLTQLFFKPDVDTDGDQQADAISAGVGFSAVPCIINK